MYTWVSTEFRRHWIPPLTRNSPIDMEFPSWHGIPLSTWNSLVDTEFRRHGIPATWNSVDTEFCRMEFCRHGIPSTRNSSRHGILPIFYFLIFSMLCYAIYFRPNSDGIPYTKNTRNSVEFHRFSRILRASLYNMYEFEYFKCKFVRIKSKISRLAEVESVSFFLVL
jgi:hypothetical protein